MPVYDTARRRRGVLRGREKGCWLYVPAEELVRAGIDPSAPPPFYRIWIRKRAVLVQLYEKP